MRAYPHQLIRRPAAARRHRDGAAFESEAAHPRRADDRARRDGRSGHRRARQGPDRPHRRFVAVHLAQSRAHPRDLRRSDGDVFGRGGRDRRGQRRVRRRAPPLHAGSVPLDADAGNEQERQSARSHSRPVAAAARAAERLQFRAALRLFRRGPVRSAPTCRCSRSRARAAIRAAASGSRRSTGRAQRGRGAARAGRDRPGRSSTSSG